jgi:predicted Fe-Mo cluster-binding NifX family protein
MKIAIPTNNQKRVAPHISLAKGFLIIDTNTNQKEFIANPILEYIQKENINLKSLPTHHKGLGVGRILPEFLYNLGVEALIGLDFKEGIARNLNRYGIKSLKTTNKEIEEILKNLNSLTEIQTRRARRGYMF